MSKPNVKVISNSKELTKQLNEAFERNPKQTSQTMTKIAIHLASESARCAPIESGDLRNNCNADINGATIYNNRAPVGAAVSPSNKVTASVGYSLPYALRQHEEEGYSHDRTDGYRRPDGTTVNMVAGGEWKYLENPFLENEKKYIAMLESIPDEVLE